MRLTSISLDKEHPYGEAVSGRGYTYRWGADNQKKGYPILWCHRRQKHGWHLLTKAPRELSQLVSEYLAQLLGHASQEGFQRTGHIREIMFASFRADLDNFDRQRKPRSAVLS
jgi:hypothetical protein